MLHELKRMFAYLLESERKSYNPSNFCKVYQVGECNAICRGAAA